MGKLAGFKYKEISQRLKELGFVFHRQAAGSHDIWYNPEGTLRAILRQAGVDTEVFLSQR